MPIERNRLLRRIRATSTPLASIFGSGFLVIVPILSGAVGPYSVWAMAAVCGLAYAVGSVIRYNIRHAEPLLVAGTAPLRAARFDRVSDLALVIAYAVSVCLYVRILAAFLMGGLGINSPQSEHILTVAVIAAIGWVGFHRGLQALQKLEILALIVTLVIIVVLLASFGLYDLRAFQSNSIQLPAMPSHNWWEILTIVGGTLIVVQGFETSRYLGEEFDPETRVSSCRRSQLISTAVYLVFVASALPLMHLLEGKVEDNGLILLAGKVSALLVAPLVAAAVLSQFSAAVADTIAGGGNMAETTKQRVDSRHAYLLICGVGIILARFDTMTILALASRAFALYYALQCLVAVNVSQRPMQRFFIRLLAAVLLFITIFSVPAG